MNGVPSPMVADLGTQELLLVLLICFVMFGAKKLPELARGSGRALRIFKAEMQGLDEEREPTTVDSVRVDALTADEVTERRAALDREQAAIDAELEALRG